MLRLQALQLTSAVKVSLCTYRNIGISIVGEVNREITHVCMIRPGAFEVTKNLLKWVIFPYPWPLSHMLCRVLVKYKYICTYIHK